MKTVLLLPLLLAGIHHQSHGQREPNEVCIPLQKCQSAIELIRRKANLAELDRKLCGTEGRYRKIWCRVPCRTPDSKQGVCVPTNECKPFLDLVGRSDTSNPAVRQFLQGFKCEATSTRTDLHICCAQGSQIVLTPPTPLPPPKPVTPPTIGLLQPIRELCGIQSDQFKVVGGTLAQLGQFPWLALLQYNNKGRIQLNCGGTLISKRYVLTAAHCVDGYGGRLTHVILGEHNITSPSDCLQSFCAPPPQTVSVEEVVQHPAWVDASSRFYDDLALLRLSKDVELSAFVQPICLPARNYQTRLNQKFTVSGWGQTESGASSDVKRYAPIVLQDKQRCLNTISIPLKAGQLCVGGGSADSCKGDSGGPLMKDDVINGQEVWYITGVVSFGYNKPCGTEGRPGIYTYVPDYVDWIRSNIRP